MGMDEHVLQFGTDHPLVFLIREDENVMRNTDLNQFTSKENIFYGTPLTEEEY